MKPARGSKRRKLWDLSGLECSIVGTCLTRDDLQKLTRKLGLKPSSDAEPYEIHAYFVGKAGEDGAISRAMHKLLEQRYEGIVRLLGKARNDAAREALWRKEFEVGRIAGAYWAFMTDAYIEEKFARRIFGEVHMLSHVLGRTTHHTATRASELAARVDQLEAQALRRSQSHGAALAARDATIATLRAEQEVRDPSAFSRQDHTVPQARPAGSQAHLLQKKERARIAARERARSAETEARVLREKVASLHLLMARRSSQPDGQCPGAQACAETVQSDVKRRILYIGGRTGGVEHLRRVAIQARAELVHHHGGEEQALGRIDGLVENCDAVFCPIDCVSHSACLKAKALCKRMQKPFVPLRSSGIASFQRALSSLTGAAGTAN